MNPPVFRLFVLGSGFSRPAGFPLGNELLEAVREELRHDFRKAGWDDPLEQEIEEWRELYPGKRLALESVFAYSHRKHFLKLLGSEEYYSHGSWAIVAAREAIQRILSRSIDPDHLALYHRFASQLKPTDVVYTFNYDTVLEDSLEAISKPYSLTPDWWLEDEPKSESGSGSIFRYLNVLKLHGSIDWYDRSYHDSAQEHFRSLKVPPADDDPLFGPNAKIPIESLARSEVSPGYGEAILPRVFRVPGHRNYFPFKPRTHNVAPFILPPAYDKILGQDPIRELWQDMLRANSIYSVITIIGYSIPDYDAYAYEALGRIIIDHQQGQGTNTLGNRRVPLQIITKADSKDEFLKNIPFIDSGKAKVWTGGFSEAALDWLDWGD